MRSWGLTKRDDERKRERWIRLDEDDVNFLSKKKKKKEIKSNHNE